MKKICYICYALIPVFSIVGVIGVAWIIAAFVEVFTNNLTMVKVFNPFSTHLANEMKTLKDGKMSPGNTQDNIFWFVQISDLHLSKYRDFGQVRDMRKFCKTTLKTINPAFVIVTGDITDAKDVSLLSSKQYEEEWETYADIMKECRQTTHRWMDVRGNHDSFMVPNLSDKENFFEKYAASKNTYEENGVSSYTHKTTYGSYDFIGVDLAPDPGPGRPFNFFGIPSEKTIAKLKTISQQTHLHNGTVWYGHYPLSVTTDPHLLRSLLSSGVAYLCGHLHTFLNWIPTMHAVHGEGFLELELGDWKENRRYRIGVFDHDIFSFVDVTYSDEPVVIVTNPPPSKYVANENTASWRAKESSHIRFLIFHDHTFSQARVTIDNNVVCEQTEPSNLLNTCPWTPSLYSNGIHAVIIELKDFNGEIWSHQHIFSLDGTRPPLGLRTVFLLLTDFCSMCRIIFIITAFCVIIIPLLLKKSSNKQIVLLKNLLDILFPQMTSFLECDRIFWKVLTYNIALVVGPNSIGYFVPGQIGIQFAYGIYTGKTFLPGTLTYLYASSQLLLFNVVIWFYLGEKLQRRKQKEFFLRTCFFHIIFVVFLWFETSSSYMYFLAYGKLSSLVNLIRTWSIFLAFYLVKQVNGIRT